MLPCNFLVIQRPTPRRNGMSESTTNCHTDSPLDRHLDGSTGAVLVSAGHLGASEKRPPSTLRKCCTCLQHSPLRNGCEMVACLMYTVFCWRCGAEVEKTHKKSRLFSSGWCSLDKAEAVLGSDSTSEEMRIRLCGLVDPFKGEICCGIAYVHSSSYVFKYPLWSFSNKMTPTATHQSSVDIWSC